MNTNIPNALIVLLATLSMLVLAGCEPIEAPTPSPEEQAEAVETAVEEAMPLLELAGTSWQLASFGDTEEVPPALEVAQPTLNFYVQRYSGYGGCNWFLGVYDVEETALRLNTPATTRGACEPIGIMDQEATYMGALTNILEYELVDETLIGYTTDRQKLVTLVPLETVPLEGTTWELAFIGTGQGVAQPTIWETQVTLQFDGDQIGGSGGCNNYTTTVELGDESISVGPMAGTLMACSEPDGVMEQEQLYFDVLSTVETYGLAGRTLVLYDANGEIALAYGARPANE